MSATAILEDRKSPSITFLAISDQYATFIFLEKKITKWPPAAILDDRKSLLIAFLAISDQYETYFFSKWPPAAILDTQFLPKSIGTSLYSRSVATSVAAQAFSSYFHKMATGGHFLVFPIAKSIGFFHSRSSSMAVSNMNLIRSLMSQLRETQTLACGGGCGCGVQTKTIISPKFQISGI